MRQKWMYQKWIRQWVVCGWCVGGVCMMCGKFKGEMAELVNQKELRGAMDMGMLWLMIAMDS